MEVAAIAELLVLPMSAVPASWINVSRKSTLLRSLKILADIPELLSLPMKSAICKFSSQIVFSFKLKIMNILFFILLTLPFSLHYLGLAVFMMAHHRRTIWADLALHGARGKTVSSWAICDTPNVASAGRLAAWNSSNTFSSKFKLFSRCQPSSFSHFSFIISQELLISIWFFSRCSFKIVAFFSPKLKTNSTELFFSLLTHWQQP